ncbi:MAG: SDR family oxidoreductase [Sporichthyaceae bacterium]|nr:SDR family oxidoreductase [Sporichthyaceae bacterium]
MPRLAIVSGAATGIGKAVAHRLAAAGDAVVILGRRADALEQTAAELNTAIGGELVRWHQVDLTKPDQVETVAATIAANGQAVDVLVNNAGGIAGGAPDSLDEVAEVWRRDFDGNVLTTVLLTQALLPQLSRPGGRIVAISSVAAFRGANSYGAAKAALHAWMYSLSADLAADGVTVNIVAPGFIPETRFWAGRLSRDMYDARVNAIPMGRPGTPDEVAAAVQYLVSADGGYTTGQILQVNGGWVTGRG